MTALLKSGPLLLAAMLAWCIGCQKSNQQTAVRLVVERSALGIELGAPLVEVTRALTIEEADDPVAHLISKYGKSADADSIRQINKVTHKRVFNISPSNPQLPKGASSADVGFFEDVLYHIGIHYGKDFASTVGWNGFTAPFIGRYGEPQKGEGPVGRSLKWSDGRTELSLEYSGDIFNHFYTDVPLANRLNQAESSAKDVISRLKK